jgi:hypothetical protein
MIELTKVIRDLADMVDRGAMTEDELKRILGYVVQPTPSKDGEADGVPTVQTDPSPPSRSITPRNGPERVFVQRGAPGWVDKERAMDLVLVSLLESGGTARRSQTLDFIENRWGTKFVEADVEMLPIAGEPRWRKFCNWAFYHLEHGGLTERPQFGIHSLTEAGQHEAEARRKNLPT